VPRTHLQSDIALHLLELQKEGYRPLTIPSHSSILRYLAKHCNLQDPESVKLYVSQKSVTSSRKNRIVHAYAKYAESRRLPFSKPIYQIEETLPFVPQEHEVNCILENTKNLRHATTLRLLYETGCRVGEASRLRFKDLDFEKRTVRVVPEKGSRARELRLSERLCAMLRECFTRYPNEPLPPPQACRKHLERLRLRLANTTCNPRLLQVHLHTFRHYRATTWYHTKKDLLWVQSQLGHRSIVNTTRYTRLLNAETDQFICKVAGSLEQASRLIEAGFDYVTDLDGTKLFRKRK